MIFKDQRLKKGSVLGPYKIVRLIGKGGMAGNVIRIKPPLCVTKDDADFIADVLDRNLTKLEKK